MNRFMDRIPHTLVGAIALAVALLFTVPASVFAASVDYKSVGIGLQERKPHPDYSLKVVFSTVRGALVPDVQVRIRDGKGKRVLEVDSVGPWLFVDLPAGDYVVWARRSNGSETSASVSVSGGGQDTVVLSFPAENRG